MTKDVLVTIQGLQFAAQEDQDNLETVTRAEYYKKDGMHCLVYEEVLEGFRETSKSLLQFDSNQMSLTKTGLINAHLIFEENKKNITDYQTPYGDIFVGIDTKKIWMQEEEDRIRLVIIYELEVNYEHMANCSITMEIVAKKGGSDT